jgi:hypothetical protein
MHQLLILAAIGAHPARIGPQLRTLAVMLPILAVQILGIRYCQCQTPAGTGTKEHLGMAHTSRVDYFSQVVYQNLLALNIFKLHNTRKLIYKNKNNY